MHVSFLCVLNAPEDCENAKWILFRSCSVDGKVWPKFSVPHEFLSPFPALLFPFPTLQQSDLFHYPSFFCNTSNLDSFFRSFLQTFKQRNTPTNKQITQSSIERTQWIHPSRVDKIDYPALLPCRIIRLHTLQGLIRLLLGCLQQIRSREEWFCCVNCIRHEILLDNSCIELTSVGFTIYNEDKPNLGGRNQGWSICEDCAQKCPDFLWNQGGNCSFIILT